MSNIELLIVCKRLDPDEDPPAFTLRINAEDRGTLRKDGYAWGWSERPERYYSSRAEAIMRAVEVCLAERGER